MGKHTKYTNYKHNVGSCSFATFYRNSDKENTSSHSQAVLHEDTGELREGMTALMQYKICSCVLVLDVTAAETVAVKAKLPPTLLQQTWKSKTIKKSQTSQPFTICET